MADSRKYGWMTELTFCYYEGIEESDALIVQEMVDYLKVHSSDTNHFLVDIGKDLWWNKISTDGGDAYTIYGRGLLRPIKSLPNNFICFGEVKFTFGARENYEHQYPEFLVTPITIIIQGKYIDYRFGDGTVWYYQPRGQEKITQIIEEEIKHSYLYHIKRGNIDLDDYCLSVNRSGSEKLSDIYERYHYNGLI